MTSTYAYQFGANGADGHGGLRNLLGGKGANLAEMVGIELPVPPGFTISTDACKAYLHDDSFLDQLRSEVRQGLARVESETGLIYGDPHRPLLLSCRSGARQSMPGILESVLNLGLGPKTIPGMIASTADRRFVYDSYRRLITMYADVVMEKAESIEPPEGQGIRDELDRILGALKTFRMCNSDADLNASDLSQLCDVYKARIRDLLHRPFPEDPEEQLEAAIVAVFKSWHGAKARVFRRIEGIPDDWGTACTVQAMVFGNRGQRSATGVAFTRDPATGRNIFYGEWLPNAQGEDIVAGIRTPCPLNDETRRVPCDNESRELPTLIEAMPDVYEQLLHVRDTLEQHFGDLQDIEFTIQQEPDGRSHLYILQCRAGKRTGTAAVNIAMDMLADGTIDAPTAVCHVTPAHLLEVLHPVVDPGAEKREKPIAEGLPAGPGGAVGQIVFTSTDAVQWVRRDQQRPEAERRGVILVREDTTPEDVEGMRAADGILTARGGLVCHAALVARGWGKCCIVGATRLQVDAASKSLTVGTRRFREGDLLTLNGTSGAVYTGVLPLKDNSGNPRLREFTALAERYRKLEVRANAESPEDVQAACAQNAEGIGLFRVEHMFYGEGAEQPLSVLRKVILAQSPDERVDSLRTLFPFLKTDVKKTLAVMRSKPVTIRLLDPPLHEFVPHEESEKRVLADLFGTDMNDIRRRVAVLREVNPMMGRRGVRLALGFAELTCMQFRAILEAAAELWAEGVDARPEIMVPFTCDPSELARMHAIFDNICQDVTQTRELQQKIPFGTMLETPRACLLAESFAPFADFCSFGTNDLTQFTFAFSRDDAASFLPDYLQHGTLQFDPFQTIDPTSVGELMRGAVDRIRHVRPDMKIGICGEHGGDAASVKFCIELGLDYVSCSVARLPVARLAAAQTAIHQRPEAANRYPEKMRDECIG